MAASTLWNSGTKRYDDTAWFPAWLRSLDLHLLVANAIVPADTAFESVQRLTYDDLHVALNRAGLAGLADVVWDGLASLRTQASATGQELNAKFEATEGTFTLAYGGLSTFFEGLDGIIGPPNPNLQQAMEHEHTQRADSKEKFTTDNYGITTTSEVEYTFVVRPGIGLAAVGLEAWPTEAKLEGLPALANQCRTPTELALFEARRQEIGLELQRLDCAPLSTDELVGGRLYTGPMFHKYNAVLRGVSGLVPFFAQRWEALCHGNHYTTTIHVINSGIVKMGKLSRAQRVYRGISGGSLPASFMHANESGVRGGIDMAFSSTTVDKHVALTYASSGGRAGVVLTAQMGMVDRGASLEWLSQYPHEQESRATSERLEGHPLTHSSPH